MNNQAIEQLLNDTTAEFSVIETLVQQMGGPMAPICKYLTHYSLMRACGVIEYSYKAIIADFHSGCSQQLQTYIDKTIRESSKNPSLDNIRKMLKCFDDNWTTQFNASLNAHADKNRLTTSLDSLNTNRNTFAHGQNCNVSFADVKAYFNDSAEIIKMVDAVVV